jgi:hypothetical protein
MDKRDKKSTVQFSSMKGNLMPNIGLSYTILDNDRKNVNMNINRNAIMNLSSLEWWSFWEDMDPEVGKGIFKYLSSARQMKNERFK